MRRILFTIALLAVLVAQQPAHAKFSCRPQISIRIMMALMATAAVGSTIYYYDQDYKKWKEAWGSRAAEGAALTGIGSWSNPPLLYSTLTEDPKKFDRTLRSVSTFVVEDYSKQTGGTPSSFFGGLSTISKDYPSLKERFKKAGIRVDAWTNVEYDAFTDSTKVQMEKALYLLLQEETSQFLAGNRKSKEPYDIKDTLSGLQIHTFEYAARFPTQKQKEALWKGILSPGAELDNLDYVSAGTYALNQINKKAKNPAKVIRYHLNRTDKSYAETRGYSFVTPEISDGHLTKEELYPPKWNPHPPAYGRQDFPLVGYGQSFWTGPARLGQYLPRFSQMLESDAKPQSLDEFIDQMIREAEGKRSQ